MKLIAIVLPFISFFIRGKLFAGVICLIAQIFIVGWLPAAIWAYADLDYNSLFSNQ